jgi:hypothetical protein
MIWTLILVVLAATVVLFFHFFTKDGTVPIPQAWRSFTVWLAAVGMVLGEFVVKLLQWLASFWEPLQSQFGDVLGAASTGRALQLISLVFFVLRMKGQGFPALKLPSIPKPSDDTA